MRMGMVLGGVMSVNLACGAPAPDRARGPSAPAVTAKASPPVPQPKMSASAPVAEVGPSPLHVVVDTDFAERLIGLEDGALASAEVGGRVMALLPGKAPSVDPELTGGIPFDLHHIALAAGRLDGDAVLVRQMSPFFHGGGAELYRRRAPGRWVGQGYRVTFQYTSIEPWSGGRLLAHSYSSSNVHVAPFFRFEIVAGPPAPLPRAQINEHALTLAGPGRDLALWPRHFATLPDGSIFLFGSMGASRGLEQGPHVERFAPGNRDSVIEKLPSRPGAIASCSAGWSSAARAQELWVACSDRPGGHGSWLFAVFDGKHWRSVQPPAVDVFPRARFSLASQADGTLWLAAGKLWTKEGSKAWRDVPMPSAHGAVLEAFDVVSSGLGGEDLWVLATAPTKPARRLILSTTPLSRKSEP